MNNISLYLLGDSICFGQLVGSHKTWASQLCQDFESLNSHDFNFLVQNAGVNGNTTRLALERLHYDVLTHKPNFVLIQFGMNDCNYWYSDFGYPRVSRGAFVENLIEISEKCLASGASGIFLATNHFSKKGFIDVGKKKFSYDESNKEYNVLIRKAYLSLYHNKRPVKLLDNEKFWAEKVDCNKDLIVNDLLLSDGIHLSEMGHNLYSEYITDNILSFVRRTLM